MITLMVLRQRLAGLIWAAILVVVVQLVPSTAQAHAGHEHHPLAVTTSATHLAAQHHVAEPAQRAATELALKTPAQQDQHSSVPSTGCTGGCFGTFIGCCGAALSLTPNSLTDLCIALEIFRIVLDARTGVDPDALARPPRPLA